MLSLKMLAGVGFAALAVIAVVLLRPLLAEGHAFVLRTPKWQRVILGVFLAVAVAFGGGKTNTVGQTSSTNNGAIERSEIGAALPTSSSLVSGEAAHDVKFHSTPTPNTYTLSPDNGPRSSFLTSDEDVASPLGSASSLCGASLLDENATMVRNINLRGAWDDTFRLTFAADWVFPYGTSHLAGVQLDTQGKVRPAWNAMNAIASLGVPLAVVPGLTAFATGRTTNNSYLVSWTNGAANRDTNTLVSAAIELFRNGDTRVTTSGVVRFTPREIPFPHDGFGQDADWVRANFTNATDILAVGYDEWVDNQVGVDLTNGLYKFTATFSEDPPEATQLTVGEWTVCVTNAGDYVFLMEKGVEYAFNTSPFDESVEFSMQDDVGPEAEVVYPAFSIFNSPFSILSSWWWEEGIPVTWTVDGRWYDIRAPTLFCFGWCYWLPAFFGAPDVTDLTTAVFPKEFMAVFADCSLTNDATYHWTAYDENVHIVSPYAQTTEVELDSSFDAETFSLSVEAVAHGRTYCSMLDASVRTNGAPMLSLSMPNTLFVNNDDDNDDGVCDGDQRIQTGNSFVRDDDVVNATVGLPSGQARQGTLRLYDKDGFTGTFYDPTVKNAYVGQGDEWTMTPQSASSLALEASGQLASEGYRSSKVEFRWSPDEGEERSVFHRFTVVEPVVEPICSERKTVMRDGVEHRLVYNPCGVVIGKDAYFRISVAPDDYPDERIRWSVGDGADGSVVFVGGNTGREVCVRGVTAGNLTLEIDIGGCSAARPTFPVRVVENVSVTMDVCILSRDGKRMREEAEIRSMLPIVNDIFEQVGMTFYIESVTVINLPDACAAVFRGPPRPRNWSFDDVANILPDAGGLKCYFIDSFVDSAMTRAGHDENGILMSRSADAFSLAHEIGHACGLDDIYERNNGVEIPAGETFEWRHAMDDWNNGSSGSDTKGSRYYRRGLDREELVHRLLMYGFSSPSRADISTGCVDGIVNINLDASCPGSARTGIFATGCTRAPVHHRKVR